MRAARVIGLAVAISMTSQGTPVDAQDRAAGLPRDVVEGRLDPLAIRPTVG